MTKYMLRSGQKKQPVQGSRLSNRNGMTVTENFDIEMSPGEVVDTDDISLDTWVTLGMVDVVYTEEEVAKIEETVIEIDQVVIDNMVATSGFIQVIDDNKVEENVVYEITSTDGEVVVIEPAVFSSENELDGEITVSTTDDSDTIEMEKEEDDKAVIGNGYKKRGRKSKK